MVRLKGFEPPTFWFVAKHSIQLSYSRMSFLQLRHHTTSSQKMQEIFSAFLKFFKNGRESDLTHPIPGPSHRLAQFTNRWSIAATSARVA